MMTRYIERDHQELNHVGKSFKMCECVQEGVAREKEREQGSSPEQHMGCTKI